MLSRQRGLPLDYLFPASGTVVIEDAIGVVRNARHPELAQAFVTLVGTVELQLAAAREAFRLPARLDLPADSLPDWVREVRRDMKVAEVDWDLIARQGDEWMRYWDQHVRGKGQRSP
jgi:ABC-type Fe3+ transport system substrate-binding protein